MADKKLSTVVGGASGLPKLAPDLSFPSTLASNGAFVRVSSIDASSGLTTLLSLTGRNILNLFVIEQMTSESITVKMTIDSVVIWNDTFVLPGTNLRLCGGNDATASAFDSFVCESSLLIELQTTADTDVSIEYLTRPIL